MFGFVERVGRSSFYVGNEVVYYGEIVSGIFNSVLFRVVEFEKRLGSELVFVGCKVEINFFVGDGEVVVFVRSDGGYWGES